MHADFVRQARRGAIVKALRAAHFLDYLPTDQGLVKVEGEEANLWPAGGHRVDPSWAAAKEGWMQPLEVKKGSLAGQVAWKPLPCDWSRLNTLRKMEAASKEQAARNEEAVSKGVIVTARSHGVLL